MEEREPLPLTCLGREPLEPPTRLDAVGSLEPKEDTNSSFGAADVDTPGIACGGGEPTPADARRASSFRELLAVSDCPDVNRLSHYRIDRLIGEGGMGRVFVAYDLLLERPVALKVMRPEAAAHREGAARFVREARALASVRHDNVVAIYEVGEDRGTPFLAMELLEGMSLAELLKSKTPVSWSEIVRIGREIASGLAAAHEKGLIHRDIKPGNVWIERPSGRVKILDFGMAKPIQAQLAQLTRFDALIGTPGFMAPEQVWSTEIDARADLFSLGCILYRMCTGRYAFHGVSMLATLSAMTTTIPDPVSAVNPDAPASLSQLIEELLEKNADRRPASAVEVRDRLARIEIGLQSETPMPLRSGSLAEFASAGNTIQETVVGVRREKNRSLSVESSAATTGRGSRFRSRAARQGLAFGVLAIVCCAAWLGRPWQRPAFEPAMPASQISFYLEPAHRPETDSETKSAASTPLRQTGIAYQALVTAVPAGDEMTVLWTHEDGSQVDVRLRLEGVAAPEPRQPFFQESRNRLAELCFEQTVTVTPLKRDSSRRVSAIVTLPDGICVNEEMIRGGFAWWDSRTSRDDRLEAFEREANQARRGLWQDSEAISPWEWRAKQRRSKRESDSSRS